MPVSISTGRRTGTRLSEMRHCNSLEQHDQRIVRPQHTRCGIGFAYLGASWGTCSRAGKADQRVTGLSPVTTQSKSRRFLYPVLPLLVPDMRISVRPPPVKHHLSRTHWISLSRRAAAPGETGSFCTHAPSPPGRHHRLGRPTDVRMDGHSPGGNAILGDARITPWCVQCVAAKLTGTCRSFMGERRGTQRLRLDWWDTQEVQLERYRPYGEVR